MSSGDVAALQAWADRRAPHVCRAHKRSAYATGITLDFEAQHVEIACSDGYVAALAFPRHVAPAPADVRMLDT